MNEEDLGNFFDTMLFLRAGDSADARTKRSALKMELDETALRLLDESHAVGRIFRHWYQVTWGDESWHDVFYGETPRQRLAAERNDISTGDALCTVNLSFLKPGQPIAVIRIFDATSWCEFGGPFSFGCAELDAHPDAPCVAPNFDPDFRTFVSELRAMRAREGGVVVRKGASDEEIYFRLFLDTVGERVIRPFSKGIPPSLAKECADEVRDIFGFYFQEQCEGRVDFTPYDHVSSDVWRVLSRIIPDILPSDVFQEMEDVSPADPVYAKTVGTFFKLHQIVDREVFMPLDLYFNAVEMVWQDKETFVGSIANMYGVLSKGKMEVNTFGRIPKDNLVQRELKKVDEEFHINHVANMWFNPGTCFRILDRAIAWV